LSPAWSARPPTSRNSRADPGMVTRILVPFEGFAGRYVWHCHILEHEDNEMMRPYEVIANPLAPSVESAITAR
jgi:FtsP/CotA-like multicopper oxidase with cupredoxin domain